MTTFVACTWPRIPCSMPAQSTSKCIINDEVEQCYVWADRKIANIFTKPLGFDKLQQFSEMLLLQLRARTSTLRREEDREWNKGSILAKGSRVDWRSHHIRKSWTSGNGGRVKKGKADRKMKAKNRIGLGKWDRTGRGVWARRADARRSRGKEPTEQKEPQVELEGECWDASSTWARSVEQAESRIG